MRQLKLFTHLRWMARLDLPEVLAIDAAGHPDPWSEGRICGAMRQHCIGMVAELRGRVVAFMVYELHKYRLHLLRLAVHPDCRRRGVGSQMVARLIGKLESHRRPRLTAEVRESNLAAQLFLRSQGLTCIGTVRGHYEDTGEDCYRFACPRGAAVPTPREDAPHA